MKNVNQNVAFFNLSIDCKVEKVVDAVVFGKLAQGYADTLGTPQERFAANITMVGHGDMKNPAYIAAVAGDAPAGRKRDLVADAVTIFAIAVRKVDTVDSKKARTLTQGCSRAAQNWADKTYGEKEGKVWKLKSKAGAGQSQFHWVREAAPVKDNGEPEKPAVDVEKVANQMAEKKLTKATSEARKEASTAAYNKATEDNAEAMAALQAELEQVRNELATQTAAHVRTLYLAKGYAVNAGATPAQKRALTKALTATKNAAKRAHKAIGQTFTLSGQPQKKSRSKKAA